MSVGEVGTTALKTAGLQPSFAKSRLRASLEALRRATGERRSSRLSGFALDPLDRAVCLAARGLLFRYLEVADLIDQEETSVGRECVEALRDAANCVDPAAYKGTEGENDKGAAAYRESIEQKAKLLERITRGEPIEDVLLSALASSE